MTHAMGIGMQRAVPEAEMERMEAFFRDRNSACIIDLCPLADPSVIAFVQSRPYRILEFNNLLARRITPHEEFEAYPDVRPTGPDEAERFARLMLTAFSEAVPFTEEMVQTMIASFGPMSAWFGGVPEPEAGAIMDVASGVAMFAGDATLSSGRRKGWQSKLIRTRLLAAQRAGCDLAVCTVLPGCGSHRNYERGGFRLIYMRVNLIREF
jgi:GNAT superfamily N-acetyltransferase